MKTEWDYSERAKTYDKRADYNKDAIKYLFDQIQLFPEQRVADIGAGTGKLTKFLLENGLNVDAIEPNNNMRECIIFYIK